MQFDMFVHFFLLNPSVSHVFVITDRDKHLGAAFVQGEPGCMMLKPMKSHPLEQLRQIYMNETGLASGVKCLLDPATILRRHASVFFPDAFA